MRHVVYKETAESMEHLTRFTDRHPHHHSFIILLSSALSYFYGYTYLLHTDHYVHGLTPNKKKQQTLYKRWTLNIASRLNTPGSANRRLLSL